MEEKQINKQIGCYVAIIAFITLPLLVAFVIASWGVAFVAWHWMVKVLLGA